MCLPGQFEGNQATCTFCMILFIFHLISSLYMSVRPHETRVVVCTVKYVVPRMSASIVYSAALDVQRWAQPRRDSFSAKESISK